MNTYDINTDKTRLQLPAIHAYLTRSYWSPGIPLDVVERAIANSMCFGIYLDAEQVGFARVVTDKATFAYLADVYVLEAHRGRGCPSGSSRRSRRIRSCRACGDSCWRRGTRTAFMRSSASPRRRGPSI